MVRRFTTLFRYKIGREIKGFSERALSKTGGRVNQAAQIAGIHARGRYNKMKRLGLRKEDFKS